MMDKKLDDLLTKIAEDSSTGSHQFKKRKTYEINKQPGIGAAVGSTLGLATGHLSAPTGKAGVLAKLIGLGAGGLIGHHVGSNAGMKVTKSYEGVAKKQQKIKGSPKNLDKTVLGLIEKK